MLLAAGLIALGLALLVVGGEALLRGAVGLATLARLTPAVIGLTVVAAGTSVPELAVSAVAAGQGKADITVGNVVGSNIFNVAFILGVAALVRPMAIAGNTTKLEYPVLAIVTLMGVAICDDGRVGRLDGTLCVAVYVAFTAYMVSLVRRQMNEQEVRAQREQVTEIAPADGHRPRPSVCLAYLAAGVALLAGGAHATVTGAVEVATALGLSERVIGLTIVSVGTGLPELVTSIISSVRGRDDVAIGNVIGSNLFNVLGILGLTALVNPLPVNPAIVASDNWWMLGVTVLLFPLMYTGLRIARWEGGLLLAVYGAYLAALLARPA
jgi:cation:H+ antiporter